MSKPDGDIDAAFLDCRLDSLDFGGCTTRALNVFARYSQNEKDEWGRWVERTIPLVTVRDLIAVSKAELLRIPNMGRKTVERVEAVLAEHGVGLRKW